MTVAHAEPWVAKRPRTPRYHEPSDLELRHTPELLDTKLNRGWPTAEYVVDARRDYEQALLRYQLWWKESWQAFNDDMRRLNAEAQREMDLITGRTRTEVARRPLSISERIALRRAEEQTSDSYAPFIGDDTEIYEAEIVPDDEEARPVGKNRAVYDEDRGWVDQEPVDLHGGETVEYRVEDLPVRGTITGRINVEHPALSGNTARRKALARVHDRPRVSTNVVNHDDVQTDVHDQTVISEIFQPAITPLDHAAEWLYKLGERYRRWRATKRA